MLYIRVDMNEQIATGHLMRCLAVAEAARESGEETLFILADDNAVPVLEQYGYPYRILHTQWNCMEQEVSALSDVITEFGVETLLIDSYQVTEAYLTTVRSLVKVAYIDDVDTMTYPVDMLICCANYWKKFGYRKRYPEIALLLGTAYVPLRAAFQKQEKRQIREQVENLLILTGGTDSYEVAKGILESLELCVYQRIDVVCGRYYSGYEDLKKQFSHCQNVFFYQAVTDIEKYMRQADVAISAGGTTLYELCACGTPTISYVIADNQLENVRSFDEEDLIDYAGDVRTDDIYARINELLQRRYGDYKTRLNKSAAMQQKVDGKGAARLARALLE